MDKSFPVFNAEQKQHVPKPRMSAFPIGVSQAASKSAVRKKKREQKSLPIVPVIEGVNDPKADSRFGQRQVLCHDRPINAVPLKQANTDSTEWQLSSLAVASGAADASSA